MRLLGAEPSLSTSASFLRRSGFPPDRLDTPVDGHPSEDKDQTPLSTELNPAPRSAGCDRCIERSCQNSFTPRDHTPIRRFLRVFVKTLPQPRLQERELALGAIRNGGIPATCLEDEEVVREAIRPESSAPTGRKSRLGLPSWPSSCINRGFENSLPPFKHKGGLRGGVAQWAET